MWYDDVGEPSVVEIAEMRAHAGKGLAILVVAGARRQRDVGECAIAVVVIKEALHGVVSHEDVGVSVAVEIGESDAKRFPLYIGDAGFCRHIGEGSLAVVVIQDVCDSMEIVRMAIGPAARLALPAVW